MKIEFVIPTFNRPNDLKVMLSSLLAQTNPNWTAHVVSDGDNQEVNNENIKFIRFINDNRIRYTRLEQNHNDWGHTARNYGLQNAKEEYVCMTGDDNYYVKIFVDNILAEAKENGCEFIYCDLVHNLILPNGYQPVKSRIAHGAIDIGNFVSRTKLAQEIKLESNYDADWGFIEQFVRKNKRHSKAIWKIDKVLYIHN